MPYWEIELIGRKVGLELLRVDGNGDYYFKRGVESKLSDVIKNNENLIFTFVNKQ